MKKLKTEKEIYISNLQSIVDIIKSEYSINIWFVEIFGKRRSFIAGYINELPISNFETIQINKNLGVVLENNVNKREKSRLMLLINNILSNIHNSKL